MARGIRVGVQVLGRPPATGAAVLARSMEAAGADSLWAPDHWMWFVPLGMWDRKTFPAARVFRNPEGAFDAFSFLTWLSTRARRAKVGVAVTEAIRRHPAQVAQAALTVHHLSRGRFILGMGAGEKENVEPYGLSFAGQVTRLEEALYLIRRLWSSRDYVSYQGRYFRLDRAVVGLGPYRRTFPPIWVGAHGPRMLRLAGRYGDGWLPTHQMEPDEYAEKLRALRRGAEDAGRRPDAVTPSYEMTVIPAPSHDEAHRLLESNALRLGALVLPAETWRKADAEHPFGPGFRGVIDYVPSRLDSDDVRAHMREVPFEVLHRAFDHGTPEQLASRVQSYGGVGLEHIVVRNVAPLADPGKTVSSFRGVARLIRLVRRS